MRVNFFWITFKKYVENVWCWSSLWSQIILEHLSHFFYIFIFSFLECKDHESHNYSSFLVRHFTEVLTLLYFDCSYHRRGPNLSDHTHGHHHRGAQVQKSLSELPQIQQMQSWPHKMSSLIHGLSHSHHCRDKQTWSTLLRPRALPSIAMPKNKCLCKEKTKGVNGTVRVRNARKSRPHGASPPSCNGSSSVKLHVENLPVLQTWLPWYGSLTMVWHDFLFYRTGSDFGGGCGGGGGCKLVAVDTVKGSQSFIVSSQASV